MRCLAVNTATKTLSLAVLDTGKTLHYFETPEMRNQGNILLSHIQSGLAAGGLGFKDIDLLAVVTGPGSFTGIRIGLAAMRDIALAAGKPLVGISSFEMFATAPRPGAINLIAVESWREELYLAAIDEKGRPLAEEMNETPEVFRQRLHGSLGGGQDIIVSGDAKETLLPFFAAAKAAPQDGNAVNAGLLAQQKFRKDGAQIKPVPYYMREADVTVSAKAGKTLKEE